MPNPNVGIEPIGTEKGYCLGGLPARPRGCRLPTAMRGRHREAFPKIRNCAERSQRLRAVPYWGGEGNLLLFGFNGRATRNFLILLVSMHYILFIEEWKRSRSSCRM